MKKHAPYLAAAAGALMLVVVFLAGRGSAPDAAPGWDSGEGRREDAAAVVPEKGGVSRAVPAPSPCGSSGGDPRAREAGAAVRLDRASRFEAVSGGLAEVLDRAGSESDPDWFSALDRIRDRISDALAEGTLDPSDVLAAVRGEEREEVLDALFEALAENADFALGPEALAEWIEIARSDPSEARRWAAITGLGTLYEEGSDGPAGRALLEVATQAQNEDSQIAALMALGEYVAVNPAAAGEVAQELLPILRSAAEGEVRAQAIDALDLYRAAPEATSEVVHLLAGDPAPEVRYAAAEALGYVGPRERDEALAGLEESYAREADPDVRAEVVASIVRAGPHRALEVLRRLPDKDAALRERLEDYAAVLESGEFDVDRIEAAVEDREVERLGFEEENAFSEGEEE